LIQREMRQQSKNRLRAVREYTAQLALPTMVPLLHVVYSMMKARNLAVLSMFALVAGCARPVVTPVPAPVPGPVPSPATVVVERAPLPPLNPTLPPVPEIHGPLNIHIVYPTPNQLIASRDSNFIFGTVGSGDAGLKINGTLVPVWPNGSFMGWVANPPATAPAYELVATNGRDSARLDYPVRLLPPAVRDTIHPDTTVRDTTQRDVTKRDTVLPPVQFALVGDPTLMVDDTDRVAIGRPAPGTGQEYKWFLFYGTPVKITGSKNEFARIELDSAAPIWIQKSDLQIQPNAYTPPKRTVSGAVHVDVSSEWVDLVVPMNVPPPYLAEESDRSISVLLYGTSSDSRPASLNFLGDKYVTGVGVAYEPNRIRYTIDLSRAPYGFLAMWLNGSFVFRVRKPPVIADAAAPLKGLTITVDPGHPPGGTTGPSTLHESEAVLAVGLKLRDLLVQRGVNVIMTRTTMDAVDLGLRPIISRRANANAFVSIHLDAEPDGVNPYTHPATASYYFWPHSVSFAQDAIAEIGPRLGTSVLGAKFGNFAVIRGTWMPSILNEGGLLIMPDVEAAFRNPQYQEAYARGILAGLESYFASLARSQ
jgi:N-acetylmuramoyl-L-alanine amidase